MRFVIATGVGSCGSSAVGGAMFHLGINMGYRLKPASDVNPKGYYEDVDYFHAVHTKGNGDREKALEEWFRFRVSKLSGRPIFGVKAPHFLGVYDKTVSAICSVDPSVEIRYVVVVRSLEEVAQSKMVKYPRPTLRIGDYRKKVEILRVKLAEFLDWNAKGRGDKILYVQYEELVGAPEVGVRKIAAHCFDGLPLGIVTEKKMNNAAMFIDPTLKRF